MNKNRERFFCPDCGQLKLACTCQQVPTRLSPQLVRLQAPTGEKVVTTKNGDHYYDLIRRGWNEVSG